MAFISFRKRRLCVSIYKERCHVSFDSTYDLLAGYRLDCNTVLHLPHRLKKTHIYIKIHVLRSIFMHVACPPLRAYPASGAGRQSCADFLDAVHGAKTASVERAVGGALSTWAIHMRGGETSWFTCILLIAPDTTSSWLVEAICSAPRHDSTSQTTDQIISVTKVPRRGRQDITSPRKRMPLIFFSLFFSRFPAAAAAGDVINPA